MAQVVECLPSKHQSLSSNPNTWKEKKEGKNPITKSILNSEPNPVNTLSIVFEGQKGKPEPRECVAAKWYTEDELLHSKLRLRPILNSPRRSWKHQ
jgi:hypothetical protein